MHNNFMKNIQTQLNATETVSKILMNNNLYDIYKNDIDKRYFWCLTEFNNWWLSRKKTSFIKKVLLKIIKIILGK